MKIFDVGDKVWHIEEQKEVTVVDTLDTPDLSYRRYSVNQSDAQKRKYGQVCWVSWLSHEDIVGMPT